MISSVWLGSQEETEYVEFRLRRAPASAELQILGPMYICTMSRLGNDRLVRWRGGFRIHLVTCSWNVFKPSIYRLFLLAMVLVPTASCIYRARSFQKTRAHTLHPDMSQTSFKAKMHRLMAFRLETPGKF